MTTAVIERIDRRPLFSLNFEQHFDNSRPTEFTDNDKLGFYDPKIYQTDLTVTAKTVTVTQPANGPILFTFFKHKCCVFLAGKAYI